MVGVAPGSGKTEWFKDIDIGPEMVVVPAGSMTMGSNDYGDEKPAHRVTLQSPFGVGRFAVTFAEWDAARLPRKHKPSDQGWGRGRRPVINVSWHDAKEYVAWLSRMTDKAYRLLSEAEWEYCCRAGTTAEFAMRGGITDFLFRDSSRSITKSQAQFSTSQTAEVGTFPPNAWGIHDMHGNVAEWVEDNWHPNYQGAPQDGSAWLRGGDASRRVLRGGSWSAGGPAPLRSASRDNLGPTYGDFTIGFRVARTL